MVFVRLCEKTRTGFVCASCLCGRFPLSSLIIPAPVFPQLVELSGKTEDWLGDSVIMGLMFDKRLTELSS